MGLLEAFHVTHWNGLDWWIQDGILHNYDAVEILAGKNRNNMSLCYGHGRERIHVIETTKVANDFVFQSWERRAQRLENVSVNGEHF